MLKKPVYVTAKGKVDLEEELEHLRSVERPRIIERLQEVKTGGDWMENTEQMLFEDELSFVNRRIQELEDMLANAELIGPDTDPTVVNIGDTVVIQDEDGALETYTILGIAEADPSEGFISNESPLGQALLNRKVGDEVVVAAPAGQLCFRIVALK
ncbi:MAG: GreA/GreB family elongation factor [Candidatus Promineifilaceae bacterium]